MPKHVGQDRLLRANAKAVQRAVRVARGASGAVTEYRIEGVRGLVLHVMPTGKATWYYHYDVEIGGKRVRRKHKIGRRDEVGLADAIAAADALRPRIRSGEDPACRPRPGRGTLTFAEVAEERLESGDPLRPGTEYDYRLLLNRDILPAIGHFPLREIAREHVLDIVDAISARGASRRADTAKLVISSVYGYAIDKAYCDSNPASGLRNRHDNRPRDVVASDDHLRRLWLAMASGEAVMTPAMANIVRLALITGQRRSEIAGIRQSDLQRSSDGSLLVLPRGRVGKNQNMHQVPLSAQAHKIILSAQEQAGAHDYLFPGVGTSGPIASRSVSKAMERTRVKLGIPDITIHDLRRTVGTRLAQYEVPKDVRERVLNHGGRRSRGVTDDVYGWYEYLPEKRAALELWADALDCVIAGRPSKIDGYVSRLAQLKGAGRVQVG